GCARKCRFFNRLALTFRNVAAVQKHQPGARAPREKHRKNEYTSHPIALSFRPFPCSVRSLEGRTFYENEIAGTDTFGWRFDVCSNPILNRRRLWRTRRRFLPAASFLCIQHPPMSRP